MFVDKEAYFKCMESLKAIRDNLVDIQYWLREQNRPKNQVVQMKIAYMHYIIDYIRYNRVIHNDGTIKSGKNTRVHLASVNNIDVYKLVKKVTHILNKYGYTEKTVY